MIGGSKMANWWASPVSKVLKEGRFSPASTGRRHSIEGRDRPCLQAERTAIYGSIKVFRASLKIDAVEIKKTPLSNPDLPDAVLPCSTSFDGVDEMSRPPKNRKVSWTGEDGVLYFSMAHVCLAHRHLSNDSEIWPAPHGSLSRSLSAGAGRLHEFH